MCRALVVLCVAPDREALAALKRASMGAAWELARGAMSEDEAIAQLESERPHVLVVAGAFERLVRRARELRPGIRVIADRDVSGADAVVGSLDGIRDAVAGGPRARGPVR